MIANLETKNLLLTPLTINCADELSIAANYPEVGITTYRIPYPVTSDYFKTWFNQLIVLSKATHDPVYFFTIKLKSINKAIGMIGLECVSDHCHAELGYWIGYEYWNKGYATEAVGRAIEFGFNDLNLNKIYAMHMIENEASGKVLQKNKMEYEATLKKHLKKGDVYKDMIQYCILSQS